MRSLADYEDYLVKNFKSEVGLDLTKFKRKTFEKEIEIDLIGACLIDAEKVRAQIIVIVDFLQILHQASHQSPLWYKINIDDQAVNNYVGIGFLNIGRNWLKFIIDYLDYDRAEEGGDSIVAVFDLDFHWSIVFTLSQDNKALLIEKFEI